MSIFTYPFPIAEKGGAAAATDASRTYFDALSRAEDGFFPIGANGQWHGGIHFGLETGSTLDQDAGVRCIAKGEVIAYRIDDDYPTVEYASCAPATYSTGFVLVRHRLQLPPAPQAGLDTTDSDVTSEAPAEPSLVLYSLYMHLRELKAYTTDTGLQRPGFWGGASEYIVGNKARDQDEELAPGEIGLRMRGDDHQPIALLPRGTRLTLGAQVKGRKGFHEISNIVCGDTIPAGHRAGRAYLPELDRLATPSATDTVVVLPEPVEIEAGELIGHLGQYQRHADMNPLSSSCSVRPLAQVEVFTGDDLETFITQSRARDMQLDPTQKNLLHVQPGTQFVQPAEPDLELAAGEAALCTQNGTGNHWAKGRRGIVQTVGRGVLGTFSSATRTYSNGHVLMSAVRPEDGSELALEQFNALPGTDKAGYSHRKVLVPDGEEIWFDGRVADASGFVHGPARAWSSFPLKLADASGPAVAHSRVRQVKSAEAVVTETDGTRWFRTAAGSSAGKVEGWVREKEHPNVSLCSPWAWPGFVLMDTGSLQPRDLYARAITHNKQASASELGQLESLSQSAEQSPLFDTLCDAIDADGKAGITPTELRRALGKPWLAQALSRLVIKHHSEWAGPMDRWDEIDELIPSDRKKDWEQEKKRIETLQFWDDIRKNISPLVSPKVHHLHAVAIVENFQTGRPHPVYRVYQNGLIELLPPSTATAATAKNARYIYIDAQGGEHDFGVFEGVSATRWIKKNVAGKESIYLMDASSLGSNPARKFGFRFTGTDRRFLSQAALASLIGTLMDTGYDDVTSTGFSKSDGTPGVSSSHINGENGDFRFLREDGNTAVSTHLDTTAGVNALDEARQSAFNNSLYKFGWKSQLAWRYTKNGKQKLLPRTVHYSNHHHHLHVGRYSPNLVEID